MTNGMRKVWLIIMMCCVCVMHADAAVRGTNSISRNDSGGNTGGATVVARAATNPRMQNTQSQSVSQRSNSISRNSQNTVSRTASPTTTSRAAASQTVTRSATPTSRTVAATSARTSRAATTNAVARSATNARTINNTTSATGVSRAATARATTLTASSATNTFGTGYNQCRNAYFTCMDQFCATANDSYRRCICSSRLTDIQERERALAQASSQLQDFHSLNMSVIDKTAGEVNAMISASEGETALKTDTSASAQMLNGISEVLGATKTNALSTSGTLDIAGDINQIWATTDLTSGQNIANLTGEALYNAVHAQCLELVASSCSTQATLNMVVSAYGMYIENDCTALANALDSQLVQANSTIRNTEREMQTARLDNYNVHNSTSINDCIANVRADITADTACGAGYVHCLDITGRYLNRDTGEPIYSPEFYQLEKQISLSGDVLKNSTNRLIVAELNSKKMYAQGSLDTCRDIADQVWDEFMRQAITEIYQGQQSRVRDVKNECLDVVNACYDTQTQSLKDFSNIQEELLLGSRLELSEEFCRDKLYACSNLYGDPEGDGINLLVEAMQDITDQKIAQNCNKLLTDFAADLCAVPSNDTLHTYPYGCRVYTPGEQRYASIAACNKLDINYVSGDEMGFQWSDYEDTNHPDYECTNAAGIKVYTSCNKDYYLACLIEEEWVATPNSCTAPNTAPKCIPCPDGYKCDGGTKAPSPSSSNSDPSVCGTDYAGSLYQQMVRYAIQVCARPSDLQIMQDEDDKIPQYIMQDVNMVMDTVRANMATVLAAECERLGGTWINTPYNTDENAKNNGELFTYFYDETGANTKWGYCATKESVASTISG